VLIGTPVADASVALPALPYGQVSRFGGFDATGKTPEKFVLPVGFAVDPADPTTADHNAVYVLDRTTYAEIGGEEVLEYRLQKLSSKGELLGSVDLPPQHFTSLTQAHPVVFLAVDSSAKRVYALVESIINANEEHKLPVVQRLVAWSTEPSDGKLVPVGGTVDKVTGGSLIAGAESGTSALEPTEENGAETIGEDLYAPEGLAVNPSNHDVVIEAQHGAPSETTGGPTILESVGTAGATEGQLEGQWLAGSIAPHTEQGGGIFTASVNGAFTGFGIDLYQKKETISRLAEVNAEFSQPSAHLLAPDSSGGMNYDEAPSIDNVYTPNRNSSSEGPAGYSALELYTAGSPIAQLSNGFYAARYVREPQTDSALDSQAKILPWSGLQPVPTINWWEGGPASKGVGNVGVRLFNEKGDIVTTIGGQPEGKPCNLNFTQMSVAAGAGESLFVLTQPNEENGDSDDEVIEFAPKGSYPSADACPSTSGEIEVNGELVKEKEGETVPTVIVHEGNSVQFDAISLERHGEVPFSFEWNFTGESTGGNEGYTEVHRLDEDANYIWPTPEAEHTFTTTGTVEASVRMSGDYGTTVFPVDLEVLGTGSPAAAFEAKPSSAVEGEPVNFDAVASKPTPGSKIVNYQWEFEAGTKVNRQTDEVSHKFVHAGEYTVKLKITDKAGNTAEASEKVIISAAPTGNNTGGGGGGGTTQSTSTSTTSTNPNQGVGTVTTTKPPTKAQKLTAALRACKKKPKKQRATCEKQARKKYGTTTHKKKRKKKK
jgi:hypothetical protein